jgi:hypothetical protein
MKKTEERQTRREIGVLQQRPERKKKHIRTKEKTEEGRSESCSAISHHHRSQALSSSPTTTKPSKSRFPPLEF